MIAGETAIAALDTANENTNDMDDTDHAAAVEIYTGDMPRGMRSF
jgi:hypothetical protein